MSVKVDLHTHSIASPDGGISANQYKSTISSGLVNCIAITDHNRIDFATHLQNELDEHVIVGEEITTSAGEIIGLFLKSPIRAGLTPIETVKLIKDQGGIVYIPHPFETVRKGIHPEVLEELADYVDIVEICNGRAFFQNRSEQAVVWTRLNHKLGVASSDAHGLRGLGKTYTLMPELPKHSNILELLQNATPMTSNPGLLTLLYPKYNRLRKKVWGGI